MYLLLDRTNKRPLARHESYTALSALAYIQFANVDANVFRCGSDGQYGPLRTQELEEIALGFGYSLPDGDRKIKLAAFRHLVETAPVLELPFDMETLFDQARQIAPDDERPYAFAPNGNAPVRLPQWHHGPQRNRSRYDTQHWINFTSDRPQGWPHEKSGRNGWTPASAAGTLATRTNPQHQPSEEYDMAAKKGPAKPAAKKAPAAPAKKAAAPAAPKAPAKPKTEKPPKAEKAPKIEQNGVVRPKAGGKCAAVWDIADKVSKQTKAPATIAAVMEQGKAAGLNESNIRAEFQRWRKFNGITGRAPKAAA